MDEDLIVLGAQAETPAAGSETSTATDAPQTDGHAAEGEATAATPGTDPADPAAEPKPDAPKPEPKDEDDDAERPKKRSGIQRMQDKISRLEAELASRSQPSGDSGDRAAAIEKEIGAAPKEEDFKDYVAFERAQRQYDVKLALAEQRHADRAADADRRSASAREETLEVFADRVEEAKKVLPDYAKVTASLTPDKFKPHVLELMVESEKGALLGYFFAQKPAELDKLNRMTPIAAAKAVGALETRLTLAKPKTATTAPKPAAPVSGAAASSADPSKMTMAQYAEWRAKN